MIEVLRQEGMAGFCARQGLGPEVEEPRAQATRHAFLAADPLAMAALFEATEATPAIPEEQLAACMVPTLWIAAAGSALAALPVLLSPLARMRDLPDEDADAGQDLTPRPA